MVITSSFPGQIAEVGVYSMARTQSQVQRPCGSVSAVDTPDLDPRDPKRVIYNLTMRNEAGKKMEATDHLTEGIELISSSYLLSSYYGSLVKRRLTDLEPLETETISYKVEALKDGTFVNRAEIEVGSVDWTAISEPLYVDSVVAYGDYNGEVKIDGWRLPGWGFNYTANSPETDCPGLCPLTSFDVVTQ
jgi:hypothetical protein